VCCEEPINIGLLCTDFELFVGVSLNVLNSSFKRRIASLAVNMSSVLLYPKPSRANNNNCGDYRDTPSQRFHDASILATWYLSK